jgi:hypothetical protein
MSEWTGQFQRGKGSSKSSGFDSPSAAPYSSPKKVELLLLQEGILLLFTTKEETGSRRWGTSITAIFIVVDDVFMMIGSSKGKQPLV